MGDSNNGNSNSTTPHRKKSIRRANTTAADGGPAVSGSRIEQLKATLRKSVLRKSVSSSAALEECKKSSGIAEIKAQYQESLNRSSHHTKQWRGKQWDELSDDEGDDSEETSNSTPLLSFQEVFQQSSNFWKSTKHDEPVPKELQAKNQTVGITKQGISKRRVLSLKTLLHDAVLDTVDDNNRVESQSNNDTNPLLQAMVSATRKTVTQRQESTGRLFQTDSKLHQKQMDRAARKLQKFMKQCMYVLDDYQLERKYYKSELKDVKRRRKQELARVQAYIQQEKEQLELELMAEYGILKGGDVKQHSNHRVTIRVLNQEIDTVTQDNQKLHKETKHYQHGVDRQQLQSTNPELLALKKQVQEMTQDQDDWNRLKDYYSTALHEANQQLESVTESFYAQRRGRKKVCKTIATIIGMTDGRLEEKIAKLKTKRDVKFQKLKEARAAGLYPLPEDDDEQQGNATVEPSAPPKLKEEEKKEEDKPSSCEEKSTSMTPPPAVELEVPPEPTKKEPPKKTVMELGPTHPPSQAATTPTDKKDKDNDKTEGFEDIYELLDLLGEGEFGAVYKCRHKLKGTERAVKILDQNHMDEWEYEQVTKEFQMLTDISNPNVIRVYEFYNVQDKFYIVQELAKGGELFDELTSKGRLQEQEVATLMRALLSCVQHLAQTGIVHRDLNLENILLDDNTGNYGNIKLIDFGLAAKCEPGERLYEMAGKARYIAPEVLGDHGYGLKSDVWSVGVTAYTLLAGVHPFEADTDMEVYPLIVEGYYDFKDEVWKDVSDQAKDFVSKLLCYKEEDRPTAAEALNHPWFTANDTGLTFSEDAPAPQVLWTATSIQQVTETAAAAVQSAAENEHKPLSGSSQSLNVGCIERQEDLSEESETGQDQSFALASRHERRHTEVAEEEPSISLHFDADRDAIDIFGASALSSPKQSSNNTDPSISFLFDEEEDNDASDILGVYAIGPYAIGPNPAKKLQLADLSQSLQFGMDRSEKDNPFIKSPSTLDKKELKKQRKLEKKKAEEKEMEKLLQSRTNGLNGEESFFDLMFSPANKGTSKTSIAGASKLKGSALLKGAVKDVMGRQRRASALQSLITGRDLLDEVKPEPKPKPKPKRPDSDFKPAAKEKKKKGAGAARLMGAVKDVMGGQRRATALMSLIAVNEDDEDSEEEDGEQGKQELDKSGRETKDRKELHKSGRETKDRNGSRKRRSKRGKKEKPQLHESALFSLITGL